MGEGGKMFQLLTAEREKEELRILVSCSEEIGGRFGLTLSENEARELILYRNQSLRKYRRVEFGRGILDKLIYVFCDSQYLEQENYLETLETLQDIFYRFKNESEDRLTDDELLEFMREQFEDICFGDTEYLAGTCLERFARAVRSGYDGYRESGGRNEYGQFSEEERWDDKLYQQSLRELFWE